MDDLGIEAASQPAFQEAHMHQGAGAQPLLSPQGGVRDPPGLCNRAGRLLTLLIRIFIQLLGLAQGI